MSLMQKERIQRSTQPSLDELNRLLAGAEKMAGVGHWHLDTKSEHLHWSDEVYRIHGHTPGAFVPQLDQAIDAYHPADRPRIEKAVNDGIATGQPWHEELRLIRADGAIRTVLAKGEPHFQKGELIALFGVFQDITEQKKQQQHYRQLSQVVELTQEGIIVADPKGRITWVNRGFEEISGYSMEEVVGYKPGDILQGPETDITTHNYMAEMIRKREPFSAEVLNYHKNGSKYWLKVNIYPQFDKNGELQAFMAVETDITETKFAQQRLQQQTDALNREIQRREQLEQELRALAYHDSLTNLFNRRYFFDALKTELSRCQRYARPLSLILLDIDYFKKINDNFGHDVGDLVLCGVAEALNSVVREPDLVARVGGEEFAILAAETDLDDARSLAERIRVALASRSFHVEDESLSITASLGVAELKEGASSTKMLYKEADEALYLAKRSGRNMVKG